MIRASTPNRNPAEPTALSPSIATRAATAPDPDKTAPTRIIRATDSVRDCSDSTSEMNITAAAQKAIRARMASVSTTIGGRASGSSATVGRRPVGRGAGGR